MLGTLCAILLIAAPAGAAPSLNGSTGMINNPTAAVLQEGQISLGYYHLKDGRVGVFDANIGGHMEVGVAGFRYNDREDKNCVNAKWGVVPETILTPGLAVGAEDIANTDKRTLYAVASKSLPFGFRLHVGMGNGRYDGAFAGIEKTVNPIGMITGSNTFPATTFMAEYDGHGMNYGARLSIVPGVKLDAGYRQHQTCFGVSFTN